MFDFFVNRRDAWAQQKPEGGYFVVREPLTPEDFRSHLRGENTIGVYAISAENTCKWVCWDIDSGDAMDAYRITQHLTGPYMVEFSGRKGYHVWQFFNEPISSERAFHYGNAVKIRAGLPNVESFPKQAQLEPGGLGNLVKLPFGIHQVSGNRSYKVDGDLLCMDPDQLPRDLSYAKPFGTLAKTAPDGEAGWLEEMFNGSLSDGRNNTLNRYIYWLQKRGWPDELVELCANYVNEKCFEEALDEQELNLLLRRRR